MAKTTSDLRAAVHAHRHGNLKNAEKLYRKILRREPRNADALHLLGVALAESGQGEAARACIAEAIRAGGPQAPYCANLGRLFLRDARYQEAVACFRQALRSEPLDVGVTFQLAKALSSLGRPAEARIAFEQAVRIDPSFAEAHFNLGVIHILERNFSAARESFLSAIQAEPTYVDAHNNLATIFHSEGNWREAAEHYEAALRLSPNDIRTRYNLGRLYEDEGRPEHAAGIYRAVLASQPEHVAARTNLGNCLLSLARPSEAIEEYRRALAADPGFVDAHWNLSLSLLQTGEFAEGWREYEWRFRQWPELDRHFEQPLWDGAPLGGRRILLHSEQGAGDTIQFARFAAFVKDRGGHVILECQAALVRLLEGLHGVDEVASRGNPLPAFDCHAPLLSLPRILAASPAGIPAATPYLPHHPELSHHWRRRVHDAGSGFRVGLAWAGNAKHKNDRNRSLPREQLAALAGLPDTTFFSLQTGPAGAASTLEPPMVPIAQDFTDFADTAAVLEHLDLIISVDTSVAHLAGALARPVWTLLPYATDWRWLENRDDSPWYPSMRLFRQRAPRDWPGVIERVRQRLEQTRA